MIAPAAAEGRAGRIVTFYSYKGGTGRSMALANVAWILASAGQRVLMVDWDLEAPGLHRYFRPFLLDPELTSSEGLIDLLTEYVSAAVAPIDEELSTSTDDPPWYETMADIGNYVVSTDWAFQLGGCLDLLPAGRQGATYATRVTTFNWQNFYDRLGGHGFIEALRRSMRESYDYVLVDSRTGVSDSAGICTVQMPDAMVVCFTLNNQSIEGAAAVAHSAQAQSTHAGGLPVLAVATRIEQAETERRDVRRDYARRVFEPLLPQHLRSGPYWNEVEMPYIPYFAYEETLAAFREQADDPKALLASLVRLTRWLTDGAIRGFEFPAALEGERTRVLAQFAETSAVLPPRAASATQLRRKPAAAAHPQHPRGLDSAPGQIWAHDSPLPPTLKAESQRMLPTLPVIPLVLLGVLGIAAIGLFTSQSLLPHKEPPAPATQVVAGQPADPEAIPTPPEVISKTIAKLAAATDPEEAAYQAAVLDSLIRKRSDPRVLAAWTRVAALQSAAGAPSRSVNVLAGVVTAARGGRKLDAKSDPALLAASAQLGRAYVDTGNYSAALDIFRELVPVLRENKDPTLPDLLLRKAEAEEKSNKLDDAVATLDAAQSAAQNENQSTRVLQILDAKLDLLSKNPLRSGQLRDTIDDLATHYQGVRNEDWLTTLERGGDLLVQVKDPTNAASYYQKTLDAASSLNTAKAPDASLTPEARVRIMVKLARTYAELKRTKEARAQYDSALQTVLDEPSSDVSAIGEPLLQLGSAVGTREIANGAARALKWKAENPRGTADDWFQAERRPAMERKRSSSDNNLR